MTTPFNEIPVTRHIKTFRRLFNRGAPREWREREEDEREGRKNKKERERRGGGGGDCNSVEFPGSIAVTFCRVSLSERRSLLSKLWNGRCRRWAFYALWDGRQRDWKTLLWVLMRLAFSPPMHCRDEVFCGRKGKRVNVNGIPLYYFHVFVHHYFFKYHNHYKTMKLTRKHKEEWHKTSFVGFVMKQKKSHLDNSTFDSRDDRINYTTISIKTPSLQN